MKTKREMIIIDQMIIDGIEVFDEDSLLESALNDTTTSLEEIENRYKKIILKRYVDSKMIEINKRKYELKKVNL